MSPTIEIYLTELRTHLAGCDPAMLQDALADAEEHLAIAVEQALRERPGAGEADVLPGILEKYGSPEETARAYREMENRITPPFSSPRREAPRSPAARFFGVLGDPRAYAALLYLLTSLVTGILYFTWAVTGISLSLGLMVLIFGLPFFGLFLFSVQGLALVEGRLVETMLGVRMPRRQGPLAKGKGIWGKFVARVRDRRTWTTLAYFVLKLPLGILHFTLFIVLLAYSLNLIALPFVQLILDEPLVWLGSGAYRVPTWSMPLLIVAGFLDLVVLLHLARMVGRNHGKLAKALLVQR